MIVVDIHEPRYIAEALSRKGVQVSIRKLDVGDYIIGELGIERKSVKDFYRSIIDGRLFDQLKRLSDAYSNNLLILEGDVMNFLSKSGNPKSILGGIITIILGFNTKLLYSRDIDETIEILHIIWRKIRFSRRRMVIRYKPKIMSLEDRLVYILQGFPGIGDKLARNVLNHYRTLKNFINTTISELSSIEGIGEKKAREIYRVITADYRKLKYSSR